MWILEEKNAKNVKNLHHKGRYFPHVKRSIISNKQLKVF